MISLQRPSVSQLDETVRKAQLADLESRASEAYVELKALPFNHPDYFYQESLYLSLKKQADDLRRGAI